MYFRNCWIRKNKKVCLKPEKQIFKTDTYIEEVEKMEEKRMDEKMEKIIKIIGTALVDVVVEVVKNMEGK